MTLKELMNAIQEEDNIKEDAEVKVSAVWSEQTAVDDYVEYRVMTHAEDVFYNDRDNILYINVEVEEVEKD